MPKLQLGTIIRADGNWSVRDLFLKSSKLTVWKPENVVAVVERPFTGHAHTSKSIVTALDKFRVHSYLSEESTRALARKERKDILQRVKEAGISLAGKHFIITHIDRIGVDEVPPYPNNNMDCRDISRLHQASQCGTNGRIYLNGLTIQFTDNATLTTLGLNNPEINGRHAVRIVRNFIPYDFKN